MGRWERIGSIAIRQHMNIPEHVAGPYPSNPAFDEVAGKGVGDGQRERDKNQEDKPCLPLPPENPQPHEEKNVDEIFKVRHKRHKPVEKGILSPYIDEMENIYIR